MQMALMDCGAAQDVHFDGSNIWVANTTSGNVMELSATDGAILGTFQTGGIGPAGLVFDGTNIWVTNVDSLTVTKLRAADGANLGSFPVPGQPSATAFDGANVWVVLSSGYVAKM